MNFFKKSLVVLVLLLSQRAFSQDELFKNFTNVISPDPVSAQFQKYLGYPVSHATGLPQISVPLYTMESHGVSLPFSLSYHASGIKVGQPMGEVGLGWSLFPGFRITRTIYGNPDDISPTNNIFPGTRDPFWLFDITPRQLDDPSFDGLPLYDGQYDVFTLHLPGQNVTFILVWEEGNLVAKVMPDSPILIEPILNGALYATPGQRFDGFRVTDEMGTVYTFGYYEGNEVPNQDGYLEWADMGVNSWMLSEVDPSGEDNSIHFQYEVSYADVAVSLINGFTLVDDADGDVLQDVPESGSTIGFLSWEELLCIDNVHSEYCFTTNETETYSMGTYNTLALGDIIFDSGETIEFEYNDKTDIDAPDGIRNIFFKDANGDLLSEIAFSHEDFQLTTVVVNDELTYRFNYDDQEISSWFARDFQGLYNGKTSNQSLIPKMVLKVQKFGGQIREQILGSADRSFDSEAAQARILKNVIYPTGGQTSFEYEPHSFDTYEGVQCGMGLRVKRIDTFDPNSLETISKTYKYGSNEDGVGYLTQSFLGNYSEGFAHAFVGNSIDVPGVSGNNRRRSLSGQSKYSNHEPNVWYDVVTEYSSDGSSVVYEYDYTASEYHDIGGNESNSRVGVPNYVIYRMKNLGTGGPRLVNQTIKDSNGVAVRNTQYNYAPRLNSNTEYIEGVYAYQYGLAIGGPSCGIPGALKRFAQCDDGTWTCPEFSGGLTSTPYYIDIDNRRLLNTVVTDYDKSGLSNHYEVTTSYSYDDQYTYNMTSKTVTVNDGEEDIIEQYYYPVGAVSSYLGDLSTWLYDVWDEVGSNWNATVIQKEVYRGNEFIRSELMKYNSWGTDSDIIDIEEIWTKQGTDDFEERLVVQTYDSYGNRTSMNKSSDYTTQYVYGNNGRYPIIKVVNAETDFESLANTSQVLPSGYASLEELLHYVSGDLNDNLSTNSSKRSVWDQFNDNLRSHSSSEGALISTYTYIPMIGMSSKTDPSEQSIYYIYNSQGRLAQIKDESGNTLKEYKYNYIDTNPSPIEIAFSGASCDGMAHTYYPRSYYSLSESTLDFGDVEVGQSKSLMINITNTSETRFGKNYISVSDIQLPSGFTLLSGGQSIPIGESRLFEISFSPTRSTAYSGSTSNGDVAIISDAYSLSDLYGNPLRGPVLTVQGTGINDNCASRSGQLEIRNAQGQATNVLDFGLSSVNQGYHTLDIQLHNIGSSDLTITYASADDYSDFPYVMTSSMTISAGSFSTVGIPFTPAEVGTLYGATVTFDTNCAESGDVTLFLTGLGTE